MISKQWLSERKPWLIVGLLGLVVFPMTLGWVVTQVLDTQTILRQVSANTAKRTLFTFEGQDVSIQPTWRHGLKLGVNDVTLGLEKSSKSRVTAQKVTITVPYWDLIRFQRARIASIKVMQPRGVLDGPALDDAVKQLDTLPSNPYIRIDNPALSIQRPKLTITHLSDLTLEHPLLYRSVSLSGAGLFAKHRTTFKGHDQWKSDGDLVVTLKPILGDTLETFLGQVAWNTKMTLPLTQSKPSKSSTSESFPKVKGWLKLKEAKVLGGSPLYPFPAHQLSGKVEFKKTEATISNMRLAMVSKDKVDAPARHLSVDGQYDWQSQHWQGQAKGKDVSLVSLYHFWHVFQPLVAPDLTFVPFPQVEDGQIDIDVEAQSGASPEAITWEGHVTLNDLLAQLPITASSKQPLSAKHLQIQSNHQQLTIAPAEIKLFSHRQPIQVSAVVDMIGQRFNGAAKSNALDLAPLFQLVKRLSPDVLKENGLNSLSGKAGFNLALSGPWKNPLPNGTMTLQGVDSSVTTSDNMELNFHNINGPVHITSTASQKMTIETPKLTGHVLENPWELKGTFSLTPQAIDADIYLPQVHLATLRHHAQTLLPKQHPLQVELARLDRLEGHGSIALGIQQTGSAPPFVSLQTKLQQLLLSIKGVTNPLRIPTLSLALEGKPDALSVAVDPMDMTWGEISANVRPVNNTSPKEGIAFETTPIAMANIQQLEADLKELANVAGVQFNPKALPELWNTAGNFVLAGEWTPTNTSGNITLNNVGASWRGGDFPVHSLNGRIVLAMKPGQEPEVETQGLSARYGNGLLQLKAQASPQQPLRLRANGLATSLVLQHFLTPARTDSKLHGDVPFELSLASLSHANDSVSIDAGADLTELLASVQHLIALKQDKSANALGVLPDADNPKVPKPMVALNHDRDKLRPLVTRVHANASTQGIQVEPVSIHYGKQLLLSLQGATTWLGNATSPWHIVIPNSLDIAKLVEEPPKSIETDSTVENQHQDTFPLWEPPSSTPAGTLSADINVIPPSSNEPLSILGAVNIADLHIPWLDIEHISGNIRLNKENSTFDLGELRLRGMDFESLTATSPNVAQYPVPLENVQMKGRFLDVDSMVSLINNTLIEKVHHRLLEQVYRPWQVGDPVIPVTFRNAELSIDEVIFQNIILDNFAAQLSMFASGYIELANTQLQMAGGNVKGRLALDPSFNHFISLNLDADHVKANALARGLLGVSNQVFGDLTGQVSYTTQGKTDAETALNANGFTSFTITDGRLPALAKIETLLTAANVIRGGVLGLSLNNLARVVVPFKTNYLADLSGSFQIAQGMAYTDNLHADSNNLDLLIQGRSRLLDGWSKYKITGDMKQDVSGRLGKLGQFSLRRLLMHIPIIGRIPTTQFGLLNIIPGFGYIPGFGGLTKDSHRFQAYLEGLPDDPAAFKSWNWGEEKSKK